MAKFSLPSSRAAYLSTAGVAALTLLGGCSSVAQQELPSASSTAIQGSQSEEYVIGANDELSIHVWRNPELSADKIRVRPDGRLTIPLVRDMPAAGKTPTMLQEDIRLQLSQYIENPIVSVIVNEAVGSFDQQVKVVGSTAQPLAIPYRAKMTVLDAMIAVGGLGEFAAGNRSKLIRQDRRTGKTAEYRLRLSDLLRKGDSSANVLLMPGDTIIIPESNF
ncbi:MAG: XrtA/PEP-CTERM system exopolysaccharide export protein [Marinomonas sp.]